MRGVRPAGLGLILLAIVAIVAAGAQATTRVSISLKAAPASAKIGTTVSLRAVGHGLARADQIRIVAQRHGTQLRVATCAKATCTGRFTDGAAETVVFRAFVVRKGKTVARSGTALVTWTAETAPPPAPAPAPTPPPAPAPAAAAGHYCGLTNEGKSICFDVTAPPTPAVRNLKTESIANCGDGSSWLWTLSFSAPVSILQPGLTLAYQYSGPLPDFEGTTNIQISYSVNATFDTAGNASGTIVLTHVSWDSGGTHYDCAGDPRTWNARLGA
jgi:hypothetical protein